MLLRRVADVSRSHGALAQAAAGDAQADRIGEQIAQLIAIIESEEVSAATTDDTAND